MGTERNKILPDTEGKYIVMFDDDDYYTTESSDDSEGKGCAIWSLVLIVCVIAGAIFLFT